MGYELTMFVVSMDTYHADGVCTARASIHLGKIGCESPSLSRLVTTATRTCRLRPLLHQGNGLEKDKYGTPLAVHTVDEVFQALMRDNPDWWALKAAACLLHRLDQSLGIVLFGH